MRISKCERLVFLAVAIFAGLIGGLVSNLIFQSAIASKTTNFEQISTKQITTRSLFIVDKKGKLVANFGAGRTDDEMTQLNLFDKEGKKRFSITIAGGGEKGGVELALNDNNENALLALNSGNDWAALFLNGKDEKPRVTLSALDGRHKSVILQIEGASKYLKGIFIRDENDKLLWSTP
ncbi:hypothetical protein LCGC14_1077090 [marine sediment metagenome]|uniref:Uncharacterized protein n=1 Tax=marine sediment metagenome TaxID=412755 RepID=A0A0F9QM63_9ZZZZ